jgi:biopolymer transport protein ExbD
MIILPKFQWWPVVALAVIIGAWAWEQPTIPSPPAPTATLSVQAQGLTYDGAEFTALTDLLPALQQDALQRPGIGVIVSGASDVPRERLVEVLHALQQAGITRTALLPAP